MTFSGLSKKLIKLEYFRQFSVCFSYHSKHGWTKFLIDIEFSKAILSVI